MLSSIAFSFEEFLYFWEIWAGRGYKILEIFAFL